MQNKSIGCNTHLIGIKKKETCELEIKIIRNEWSGRQDLNLRLLAPHASALPGCATSR